MPFRTNTVAKLSHGGLLFGATALVMSTSSVARAEDPTSLIQKTVAQYSQAKAYQAVLKITQTGKDQAGKPGEVVSNQRVIFKAPNFFYFETKASGKGAASDAAKGNSIMVSDGKTLYQYLPAMKQYVKQAAPPTFSMLQIVSKLLPSTDNFVPDGTTMGNVGGQPATVIKMKAIMPNNIPANITSDQKKRLEQLVKTSKPVILSLSKTNHILRIERLLDGGKLDIVFTGETFAPNIAMSIFKFTPPAGAKEYVQPAGGAPPQQPGIRRP